MNSVPHYSAADVRPKTINVIGNNLDIFKQISGIYELIGNEVRLKILYVIEREKSISVQKIADILQMELPAVSKHLKKLKAANLLSSAKFGHNVFYSIHNTGKEFVLPLLERVKVHISMKKLYQMEEFSMYFGKIS